MTKQPFIFTGVSLNNDINVEDVEKQKQFMTSRCIHKNTTKKSRRSNKGKYYNTKINDLPQDHFNDYDDMNDENTEEYDMWSVTEDPTAKHKVTFGFQHRNHKRQKSRVRHTKQNKVLTTTDE